MICSASRIARMPAFRAALVLKFLPGKFGVATVTGEAAFGRVAWVNIALAGQHSAGVACPVGASTVVTGCCASISVPDCPCWYLV